MRNLVLATVVTAACLAAPADAQLRTSGPSSAYYQFSVARSGGFASTGPRPDPYACLTRRATGRVECHSIDDWRRIAAATQPRR